MCALSPTQVNGSSVDLLILEYTQNSLTQDIWRPDQAYGAEERQALERIFRRALGMTSRPAVVMLHSYTSKFAGEGRGQRVIKFRILKKVQRNLFCLICLLPKCFVL